MLLTNNTEINAQALNEKLTIISANRRRPTPLFGHLDLGKTDGRFCQLSLTQASPGMRGFVRKIPVVGRLVVGIYRRTRALFPPGLHWKQRLRLVPLIGSAAAWVNSLLKLSSIRQQLESQRQHVELQLTQLHYFQDAAKSTFEKLNARINQLEEFSIAIIHAATIDPVEKAGVDRFYLEFEDAFRGTREDIFERLKIYLPYFDKFINDDTAHVVDVGCGRGEWLALLGQHGIKATGIDLNQAMIDSCRALGFEAKCMDMIQYLRQQPAGSLAAITGFHIIEHLSFKTLLALFDAALFALRPDGIVIFETPNPENIQVGSCNFYYDPTHLNPIVPVVAQFIARQRGFARVDILRLHPYPANHRLIEDSEMAKRFNNEHYGPQDFSILAWKTHEI